MPLIRASVVVRGYGVFHDAFNQQRATASRPLTGGKKREEQLALRVGHKTRPPVLSGLPGSMQNLAATARDLCEYLPALMQEKDSALRGSSLSDEVRIGSGTRVPT